MYLSGETKLVTAQSKRKRQARKELLLPLVGIEVIPEVRRVQARGVTGVRPETGRFRRGQDETW